MRKLLVSGLGVFLVLLVVAELYSHRAEAAEKSDAQFTTQVGGAGPDLLVHPLATDTDGTLHVRSVLASSCPNPTHSVVSLTAGSASLVPAAALSGRVFVQINVTKENTGSPLVKCRADGIDPVMGAANPGDVYGVGDGYPYPLTSTQTLKCTTDTTGTVLTVLEC